VKFSYPVH